MFEIIAFLMIVPPIVTAVAVVAFGALFGDECSWPKYAAYALMCLMASWCLQFAVFMWEAFKVGGS